MISFEAAGMVLLGATCILHPAMADVGRGQKPRVSRRRYRLVGLAEIEQPGTKSENVTSSLAIT